MNTARSGCHTGCGRAGQRLFLMEGQVLRTFAVYFRRPGRPTDARRRLIELCTHTAAIAIVKDRETEALRRARNAIALPPSAATWVFGNGTSRPIGSCGPDELRTLSNRAKQRAPVFTSSAKSGALCCLTQRATKHDSRR